MKRETNHFEKYKQHIKQETNYDHYPDFRVPNRGYSPMSAAKENKKVPVKHPFVVPWQMQND